SAEPPNPWTPAGPAPRFFFITEPSAAIRAALPGLVDENLVVQLSVSAETTLSSADFGPTAQYCVCDADCVDVCNCAGGGCNFCACEPLAVCSDSRGCVCTAATDGTCPGLGAPYDVLDPPCYGVLYGPLAQPSCEQLVSAGENGTAVHVARTAPGVAALHATAAGYASATWVLVADNPRTLIQTPAGLSASGHISYAGDQDWFEMHLPPFPQASSRLVVAYAPSPVDIRFRVFRGNNPADNASAAGFGRTQDICDMPEESCGSGGTCDTDRNSCSYDAFGTLAEPKTIDPLDQCTFIANDSDRLFIWVNEVDFNDWDEVEPYSFRVELIEGCSAQCSPFLCAQ
ncbi:hypothetical protein ACFL6C_12840, partial [Myxococcota bacterium]